MSKQHYSKQISSAVRNWWREQATTHGRGRAAISFLREMWGFLVDSTPERRRRRYGDMDYDWEHRVNTTSGNVGWRERLLGTFLTAYQPTDPAAFREMMSALSVDFREFAFVDIGSGKGRTLLMASEYPFQRIVGVEIVPELHRAAEENTRGYRSSTQRCSRIESVCMDARNFVFPQESLVLYLFNPLPIVALDRVLINLKESLRQHPRPVYVVYHNPLLEDRLSRLSWLKLAGRPNQSVIYRSVAD